MSSIYLIRHGQASFGQNNYDQLSDLGEQQASVLGESMSQRVGQFDKVLLGDMKRHEQTADLCLSQMGQALSDDLVTVDARWNEYDHQDILAQFHPELETGDSTQAFIKKQSNPKQAFEKVFNDAIDRWMSGDHDDDYNETWTAYKTRVRLALDTLVKSGNSAKHIGVFTSGGPISLLAQSLLDVPGERMMQLNWTVVNCGVTKVVNTGKRVFVGYLNEHVHFEGEMRSYITYR